MLTVVRHTNHVMQVRTGKMNVVMANNCGLIMDFNTGAAAMLVRIVLVLQLKVCVPMISQHGYPQIKIGVGSTYICAIRQHI